MSLCATIEAAFDARPQPRHLVADSPQVTAEVEAALTFEGRSWQSLTGGDWAGKWDALYGFTPEAFAYYLPSVLSLSVADPARVALAADMVINQLMASLEPKNWTEFFDQRFGRLNHQELLALQAWVLELSDVFGFFEPDTAMHAYEVLELLLQRHPSAQFSG